MGKKNKAQENNTILVAQASYFSDDFAVRFRLAYDVFTGLKQARKASQRV